MLGAGDGILEPRAVQQADAELTEPLSVLLVATVLDTWVVLTDELVVLVLELLLGWTVELVEDRVTVLLAVLDGLEVVANVLCELRFVRVRELALSDTSLDLELLVFEGVGVAVGIAVTHPMS